MEALELGSIGSDKNEESENESVESKSSEENEENGAMMDENSTPKEDSVRLNFTLMKKEFSWESLWHTREWSEIGTTAAKNFMLGFIPTCSDLYSDIQLFFNYASGAMYLKTVDTLNHQYVNSTACTLNYSTITNSWNGTDWAEHSVKYTYSCFETDPIYAMVSFMFIFVFPGLFFVVFWTNLANEHKKNAGMLVCYCCFSILMPLYPFGIVFCKIISIFHNGKEFKKLSTGMTSMEGMWEAAPQLCINIFILCSRGDRHPSKLQWFSLVTSAIAFNIPRIEIFTGSPQDISTTLKLLPLFLTTTLFRLVSIVIVFVLLKWLALFIYVPLILLMFIMACIPTTAYITMGALGGIITSAVTIVNISVEHVRKHNDWIFMKCWQKKMTDTKENVERLNIRQRRIHMVFWLILNSIILLTLLMIANLSSNIQLSSIGHSWKDIAIVADIAKLNILIASTLVCGIVSLVLFYFQVDQAHN